MLKLLTRYLFVGLANTLLTASLVLILTYIGLGVYSANALGYAAGIILSFILNSRFTFSTEVNTYRLIKFFITCLACYIVNIMALRISIHLMPDEKYLSQLLGMALYTASGFVLNKLWVMK